MTSSSHGLSKPSLVIRLLNRTITTPDSQYDHPEQQPNPHYHHHPPPFQESEQTTNLSLSHLSLSRLLTSSTPSPHLRVNESHFTSSNLSSSVPYLSSANLTDSESPAINVTTTPYPPVSWTDPDIILVFGMIIFYAIFVIVICVLVIRIAVSLFFFGSSFHLTTAAAPAEDGYSDNIEGETSSKTRGVTQTYSTSKNRRFFQHEMTSFAVDRTNSPSIIDEEEEES